MSARTVEHLFAALAALGLHRGSRCVLEGEGSRRSSSQAPALRGSWMDASALDVPRLRAGGADDRCRARGGDRRRRRAGTSFAKGAGGVRACGRVELELGDARLARASGVGRGARSDFARPDRVARAARSVSRTRSEELAASRGSRRTCPKPETVIVIGPQIPSPAGGRRSSRTNRRATSCSTSWATCSSTAAHRAAPSRRTGRGTGRRTKRCGWRSGMRRPPVRSGRDGDGEPDAQGPRGLG